ncbi:hypothetical protein FF2_008221 [Malus domestica]
MASVSSAKRGRGQQKHYWTTTEDTILVESLLKLHSDPTWRADTGFKNGYLGKIEVMIEAKLPRFKKSQHDSFLPVIEDGSIVFMGATTENPYFHLIRPLLSLSRCRVLVLRPLRPHVAELLLKWAASASNNKGLIPKVWMPGSFCNNNSCPSGLYL